MAKKSDPVIEIDEKWLDLKSLNYPSGTKVDDVLSIITYKPTRINLSVVVPRDLIADDEDVPKFDIDRIAAIRKLRETMELKVAECMSGIARARISEREGNDEAYSDAKKLLEPLNSFLERSFKELRPLIRAVVAKAIGGKAKAESLQTIGSIGFKEYRIKPGAFQQELESEPKALDLTKAFKNRKPQQCGIAWNGTEGVISVRAKKEFTGSELKELREHLPKGKAAGAKYFACQFRLEKPKLVILEVDGKRKLPEEKVIKRAIDYQCNRKVTVQFLVNEEPTPTATKEKSKEKKTDDKGEKSKNKK